MLDDPDHWILEPHLQLLNNYIVRLVRHDLPTDNLMVFMPPRHGKSTLISKYTPAWFLACWPRLQVLLAAYGDEFAAQWGGKARDLVDKWGPELFAMSTRDDSSAKSRWEITQHGGGMQTAGIGGPLTGKGGHLKIVDDPVKDQEEAKSKIIQERNWEWYRATFRTRSNPGGVTILLMTRWDKRDLAGMILAHEPEKWTVLNFPALAEKADPEKGIGPDPLGRKPGEALSKRYPRAVLLDTRETLGPHWWTALYQGQPTPRAGGKFKRDRWRIVPREAVPSDVKRVRKWDLAATSEEHGSDPDWTRGVLIACSTSQDAQGKLRARFWIEDLVSLRGETHEVQDLVLRTAERDGRQIPIHIDQDPGSAGKSVAVDYVSLLPSHSVITETVTGDKEKRSDVTAPKQAVGNLMLVEAPWNQELIEEHAEFPTGAHDDIVDAVSGGVIYLAGSIGKVVTQGKMVDTRRRGIR